MSCGVHKGIPNLEYLGLGYDILKGNPRGDIDTELDPGFRYRVISLVQDQAVLTVDQEYTVPLGTELKYISSCKYDEQSVEVSSEEELKESMEREAGFKSTSSSSVSASVNTLFWKVSASRSSKSSFSQSAKLKVDIEENIKTSSVSFESRAICSEYEAAFIPTFEHQLDPHFVETLDRVSSCECTDVSAQCAF